MNGKTSTAFKGRNQGPYLLRLAGKNAASRLGALPPLLGTAIHVEWAPALHAVRGHVRSGGERGTEVHAASFLRERRIVFDDVLRRDAGELSRILVHEIFHFAWVRLSNDFRQSWRQLLTGEFARGARGELGWSAESRKSAIRSSAAVTSARAWSEYSCESFCDTAAWIYAANGEHEEFTLAQRFREIRRMWFLCMESHHAGMIRI